MDIQRRKRILDDYNNGDIQVICACDLLNEGWDSPITSAFLMARPTMSKLLCMQQLGRGMRKHKSKDFLLVLDFVDNCNMFKAPCSLHRVLGINEYRELSMVLGTKAQIKWDSDMFARGERPEVLLDYPIYEQGLEIIDLFDWREEAKDMYSVQELVRHVSCQAETVEDYIRKGRITPDMVVPLGESGKLSFFKRNRVSDICREFGWKEITPSNKKSFFLEFCKEMKMTYSHKPVFLKSFFT